MSSSFASGGPVPYMTAHTNVDFKILHQMLRFPDFVSITGVRPDPANAHGFIVDLTGLVPGEGELIADYTFQNTTIVNFKGFRQPAPK